jgi:hypothetical protein
MRKNGPNVVGSSILYPLFGFPMEGQKVACAAEGCLAGEEDGITVDCAVVVFVRAVLEA